MNDKYLIDLLTKSCTLNDILTYRCIPLNPTTTHNSQMDQFLDKYVPKDSYMQTSLQIRLIIPYLLFQRDDAEIVQILDKAFNSASEEECERLTWICMYSFTLHYPFRHYYVNQFIDPIMTQIQHRLTPTNIILLKHIVSNIKSNVYQYFQHFQICELNYIDIKYLSWYMDDLVEIVTKLNMYSDSIFDTYKHLLSFNNISEQSKTLLKNKFLYYMKGNYDFQYKLQMCELFKPVLTQQEYDTIQARITIEELSK